MTALTGFAALYHRREQLPVRTRLLVTFGAVVALHAAAAVLLLAGLVAAGEPLALGLVLTAYMAGVKHSYDWDHLAAIDNSTESSWPSGPGTSTSSGSFSAWGSTPPPPSGCWSWRRRPPWPEFPRWPSWRFRWHSPRP